MTPLPASRPRSSGVLAGMFSIDASGPIGRTLGWTAGARASTRIYPLAARMNQQQIDLSSGLTTQSGSSTSTFSTSSRSLSTQASRRWLLAIGLAVVAGVGAVSQFAARHADADALYEPTVSRMESAPLCPWREPEADMRRYFPEATRFVTETRILSGLRVELARDIGRIPTPEENALNLHRVFAGSNELGCVVTRRVKGQHGAIELIRSTRR